MATQTSNYHLTKPEYGDSADISVINRNMDTLDSELKSQSDRIDGVTDGFGTFKPSSNGTADQILRSNGDGTTRWDAAATQAEIGAAVTDWLDEHVAGGQTLAIDDTLSVQGAAADSKKTGDKITDLKNAIDYYLFESSDIEPAQVVNDGYITQTGGYNAGEGFQIKKYQVVPGELLNINVEFPYVSSGGVWQFQNNQSIPYPSNEYIVGETHTSAFTGYVVVPAGATWLMVVNKTGSDNNKILRNTIVKQDDIFERKTLGEQFVVPKGYIMQSGGYNANSSFQIKKYPVKPGSALYVDIKNPYVSSGGVYQFQNNASIPYPPNNYIVGETATAGFCGELTVPSGATWLMVVSKINDDQNIISYKVVKEAFISSEDDGITEKIRRYKDDSMQYRKGNTTGSWYDRFVLFNISDNHVGTTFAQRNLFELSNVINGLSPDAVVNCGDMTNGGGTTRDATVAQLKTFTELSTDVVNSSIPIIATLGNHDANDSSESSYASATTKQDQWDNVFEAIAQKYPGIVWGDRANYRHYGYLDITKGSYGLRIIALDGLDHDDYESADGVYKGQWNEVYSQAQIDWFCNTALNVPADYGVIIVNHFPFAPRRTAGYSEEWPVLNDGTFAQGWDMIPKIIRAWENRGALTEMFADSIGTQDINVSADFSSVPASALFVCYLTGHTHSKNAYEVKAEKGENYHQLMLCEDSSGQQGSALNRVYKYDDDVQNTAASQIVIDMAEKRVYRTAYGAYQKCSEAPNGRTAIFGFAPYVKYS